MHFTRSGDYLRGVRIIGPSHHLLGLKLTTALPSASPVTDLDAPRPGAPSYAAEVLQWATEGVGDANAELGTNLSISGIEYVSSDGPSPTAYRVLAHAIAVRHTAPA